MMEFLALAWVGALIIYFFLTTERQRENFLLVAWVLMLLPVGYSAIKVLLL
jgi:hypothetical protein